MEILNPFEELTTSEKPQEESLGTTILAMTYNGGVLIAADTCTSMGSYAFNRLSVKIKKIQERIYTGQAGTASHSLAIVDYVRYFSDMYSMNQEGNIQVYSVAKMISGMLYNNPLSSSMILAGVDSKLGPQIYQVCMGGSIVQENVASTGTGSVIIQSYLDANWKPDLTKTECLNLAKCAVSLSISRDVASYGCIRIVCIQQDNVEYHFVPHDELFFKA